MNRTGKRLPEGLRWGLDGGRMARKKTCYFNNLVVQIIKSGLTLSETGQMVFGVKSRRESGHPPPLDGAPSAAHCPARMNGLFAIGGICRIIIS